MIELLQEKLLENSDSSQFNIEKDSVPFSEARLRSLANLRPFRKGHAPLPHVGRPKGVKNAQTLLLEAAPRLAKRYLKEALTGNPALLVDARRWMLPIEQMTGQPAGTFTDEETAHIQTLVQVLLQRRQQRRASVGESASRPTSPQPATLSPTVRDTQAMMNQHVEIANSSTPVVAASVTPTPPTGE